MEHLGMESHGADVEFLINLVKDNTCRTAVEVGTWTGATACKIADAGCSVVCIDWFKGTEDPDDPIGHNRDFSIMWPTFCKNVGDRLWRNVFPVVTETTGADWITGPFDLAFIDADHRYEHVLADLDRWVPTVRPGGIIACHDCHERFPGVVRAVKEFRDGQPYEVSGHCLAWWRV